MIIMLKCMILIDLRIYFALLKRNIDDIQMLDLFFVLVHVFGAATRKALFCTWQAILTNLKFFSTFCHLHGNLLNAVLFWRLCVRYLNINVWPQTRCSCFRDVFTYNFRLLQLDVCFVCLCLTVHLHMITAIFRSSIHRVTSGDELTDREQWKFVAVICSRIHECSVMGWDPKPSEG